MVHIWSRQTLKCRGDEARELHRAEPSTRKHVFENVLGNLSWKTPESAPQITRWSTTLSSKVNLPHVINFRALCGANLVT